MAKKKNFNKKIIKALLKAQRKEITEHCVYKHLAIKVKSERTREVLLMIANDEQAHYNFLRKLTARDVKPSRFRILIYSFIARAFGLTFTLKFMERGEDIAQSTYKKIRMEVTEVDRILKDENWHERKLLDLIDEEKLKYISSIILGLNDALVELTGVLAGLTLALRNTKLIAVVGLITGIAAAMSMAASEYLSTKHERSGKNPVVASVYTGMAYIFTVIILVLPFLLFSNAITALVCVLLAGIIVIAFFTFYVSVARNMPFFKRFAEMAGLSVSIALINFFIGIFIRKAFHIDM